VSRQCRDGDFRERPNVVSIRFSDRELARLDAGCGGPGNRGTYLRDMFLAPVPGAAGAVTPEAVEAAAKVLMRGGTVQDMLEAAAPLIVSAALGDSTAAPLMAPRCPTPCDGDCEQPCHEVHVPTWKREHNPEACVGTMADAIRAAERARCATVLAHLSPLDFLRAHGLEPGAGTGRVLVAAAAHILAPGVDGPGRPRTGPSTARAVPGGSGTAPDGSEPAETATAP
jgi:hypothetical protein